MWKPIAAGLMCLGFVTLGIAASRAQEDVIVIEGQPEGEPVPATPAEGADLSKDQARETTVQVEIGTDGNSANADRKDVRIYKFRGDGETVVVTEDERAAQELKAHVRQLKAAASNRVPTAVLDPGTREALEKLIASLKAEAKRLNEEGKNDEIAKKQQSIQALEQLLNPGQRWSISTLQAPQSRTVRSRLAQVDDNSRPGQELKKLHARLTELRNQTAINQDAEAHVKIQQEIAELQKKLAEALWQASGAVAAHPGGAGAASAYNPYSPPGAGDAAHILRPAWVASSDPPEATALTHKAMALHQAAAQLQQAGLSEQSADLRKQAETLQAQAEKIRAHTRAQYQIYGGGAAPAVDLQRSIRELQEQIQQLRKEIGELRELLQKPRQ